MNILICDDMKAETDKLARLLRGLGAEPVIFNNAYDVLDYIHTGAAVDVCFFDIIIPEMSGVKLAEQLRADGYTGEIIFLSTSNDYAAQSYNVKAFYYLLKPPTVESVRSVLNELENLRKKSDRAGIIVNVSNVAQSLLFRDISHVEVINHYVYFHLTNGREIGLYATFGEITAQLLSDRRFVQCHRSFLVNMDEVAAAAEREFTMRCGKKIPISRNYPGVKQKYMQRIFGGDDK